MTPTIAAVPTSIAAFLGRAPKGTTGSPVSVFGFTDYTRAFGPSSAEFPLSHAVQHFFLNGGSQAIVIRVPDFSSLLALDQAPVFNLLCLPEHDLDASVHQAADAYCAGRRAIYLVDPPLKWATMPTAAITVESLGITGTNSAVYFPRIRTQDGAFPPCGAVAGVIARTDTAKGFWKAPAGTDAKLTGVTDLEIHIDDGQNGQLSPLGINCLRILPGAGPVVWGARVLHDENKYLPVRRTVLFIEESVQRGTQWAVFENNNEALWSVLRTSIGAFLTDLQRQGAFFNWFVRVDTTTMTQQDIANGVLIMVIGIAPVRPAEFVIFQIRQLLTGQKKGS